MNEAWRFSFYQAVRLIEQRYRQAAKLGRLGPASSEIIRFKAHNSFSFPVSDVIAAKTVSHDGYELPRYHLTTSFLGLYGSTTPLPTFYAEEILWKDDEEDPVRGLLDIFHHRFISFLYRAWTKYRYHAQFEDHGKDEVSWRLLGLLGMGTTGLVEQGNKIPATRLIRYAGLLTQQPRSASGMENLLSDYFDDTPISVEQCIGQWVSIDPEQRTALGQGNCHLGSDCTIGERVYSRAAKFRIGVGPTEYDRYIRFLPINKAFEQIYALAKLFVHDSLDMEIEGRVCGKEIPALRITTKEQPRSMAKLGWTTWLSTKETKTVQHVPLHPMQPGSMRLATREEKWTA